ncbi:MAG: hypothetical protein EPO13_07185 [Actinomycetota bacterium]|nr:MAG: hypothetical protein EPO13_07185 [Actinomycetota bacterium]
MTPVAAAVWEYRELAMSRATSREAARTVLTDIAERGSWELARVRVYPDGRRRVWLRRKIIRAVRTA